MELFSVKRYDEEKSENDPENEDEILQKLMKKVEKRKRKLDKERRLKEQQEVEEAANVEVEEAEENAAKKTRPDSPEKDEQMKNGEENEEKTEPPEEPEQELTDFQVLGEDKIKKKKKVDMVLPPWLAYPTIVPNVISTDSVKKSVDEITYLCPQLKTNLKKMKFETLFPVQDMVIPWIIDAHSKPFPYRPRDVCVSAPTGSGKTLAFAVPVVQILLERVELKIRALVVLPVNELAVQVFDVFKRLCFRTELKPQLLTKSNPFHIEQASLVECYKGKYYSKVDIIVTTPGRLVEHLNSTKGLCFKDLKFLIVDEADRIMEQAHHNWLYHLEEHIKAGSDRAVSGRLPPLCLNELEHYACKQPHKLLYSATLSSDPEKLQNLRLFQPKLFTSVVKSVDDLLQELLEKQNATTEPNMSEERRGEFIGKYTTPAELTEKYCITEPSAKPLTLFGLISTFEWKKFLCFANSAETAHRLAFVLQDLVKKNLKIEELSAHLKPKVRKTILNQFILGKVNGLICSDALTRGIDIPDVDVVISYDAPRHIKTYIHRIGRTARAGRKGTAVTLLTPQEENSFKKIVNDAGKESVEKIKLDIEFEECHAKELSVSIKRLKEALEGEARFKEIKEKFLKGKSELNTQEGDNVLFAGELQSQLAEGISLESDQIKQVGPKSWLSSCKEENKTHKFRRNVNLHRSSKIKRKQKKLLLKAKNES